MKRFNNFQTFFILFLIMAVFSPVFVFAADLTIYAYDSFVSEWGPAGKVIPKFEKKYGLKVELISVGDAGQVLNRAILEIKKPKADIILGIDNNLLSKALDSGILMPYTSENLKLIPEELIFDKTHHVTPFDHGYFAIVYDSVRLKNPPGSLDDLLKPEFRGKLQARRTMLNTKKPPGTGRSSLKKGTTCR
jgi:thiamine transport system substrate-binding protein